MMIIREPTIFYPHEFGMNVYPKRMNGEWVFIWFFRLKDFDAPSKELCFFYMVYNCNIFKIVYDCMCVCVSLWVSVFGVICLSHLVHFVQYSIVAKCSMHSYCQMVVAPVLDVTNFDCSKLGFEVLPMVRQMVVVHQDWISATRPHEKKRTSKKKTERYNLLHSSYGLSIVTTTHIVKLSIYYCFYTREKKYKQSMKLFT